MARTTADRGTNRAKLIAAAYQVLMEQGYEAASIKEIAKAASVAPGLVHYYFASKDELLLAVLEEAAADYATEMRQLSADQPPERIFPAALAARQQRVLRQPDRERLRYEIFALGLTNPTLRPSVARLLATGRDGISNIIRAGAGDDMAEVAATAAVFLAALDGLALQKLLDPDFDLARAYGVLERLARQLLAKEG